MSNCPKCKTEQTVKDGFVNGKQRYFCKQCGYRHTVSYKHFSEQTKQMALQMYLEGLGFRSIGRILQCSHVSVYRWIKAYGEKAQLATPDTAPQVVEMDEMHTTIGSKKRFLALDCGR